MVTRMRGLRDWLPLFMPVLIGGLERALQLAEAMTTRGFAGGNGQPESQGPAVRRGNGTVSQIVLALGAGRCACGWGVAASARRGTLARTRSVLPLLLIFGTAATLWVVWRAGSHVHRTRYRRSTWTGVESACAVLSVVAVLPILILTLRGEAGYSPYPRLALPGFDPLLGLPSGLLAPMGLQAPRRDGTHSAAETDGTEVTAGEGRRL